MRASTKHTARPTQQLQDKSYKTDKNLFRETGRRIWANLRLLIIFPRFISNAKRKQFGQWLTNLGVIVDKATGNEGLFDGSPWSRLNDCFRR